MAFTRQQAFDRFAADLAKVIGVLIDVTAAAEPSSTPPSGGGGGALQAGGGSRGELKVEFDRATTEVLVKRITGIAIEPPNEVVVDTLKEVCAQAGASMVLEPPLVGTKLIIASVGPVTEAVALPVLAQIRA